MSTRNALLSLPIFALPLVVAFSFLLSTTQGVLAFAPPSYSIRQVSSPTTISAAVSGVVGYRSTYTSMSSSLSDELTLPNDETLTSLLDVAVRASKLAGEIILGNAGGADVLKSKANSRDLLTMIDPLCEKVCVGMQNQEHRLALFVIWSNIIICSLTNCLCHIMPCSLDNSRDST